MGMIFNNDATLETIKLVNQSFRQLKINALRANNTWNHVYNTNNGMPGNAGTYNGICVPLGIDHQDPQLQAKWHHWLTHVFDNSALAQTVGQYINQAIIDTDFIRIEFFAVQDPNTYVDPPQDVQLANGKFERFITIHVLSMDNT
jgi:hypothetical protein